MKKYTLTLIINNDTIRMLGVFDNHPSEYVINKVLTIYFRGGGKCSKLSLLATGQDVNIYDIDYSIRVDKVDYYEC